ncbi:hypothetical protein N9M41_06850 [Rhodopirellula sp.]|nr:hypothetical protein [Rhodopirellula sp.]
MKDLLKWIPRSTADILVSVCLLSLVAVKIFAVACSGVNEDIDMVLTPTRVLVNEGNMSDVGQGYPFQAIRDATGDREDMNRPFYLSYFGPVLYFAPFVMLLGSGTSVPFAVGQAVSLLIFCGLTLWLYREQNCFRVNAILLLGLLAVSIDGSIYDSPTQLPFYPLLLLVWFYRDQYFVRPLILGILLGASYQFRPEALALLAGLMISNFCFDVTWARYLKSSLIVLVVFLAVHLSIQLLRSSLGADTGTDHLIAAMGIDVLDDGFGVMFGSTVYTVSDFFESDAIRRMLTKVFWRIRGFHWNARQDLLMIIPFALFALLRLSGLNEKCRRGFVFWFVFVAGTFAISFVGTLAQRYYDPVFVITCFLALELWPSIRDLLIRANRILLGFAYICIAILLFLGVHHTVSQRVNNPMELSYRNASDEILKIVPKEYRMLSRHPEYWSWYGHGRTVLFHDNRFEILPAVMHAYEPEAMLVFLDRYNTSVTAPEKILHLSLRRIIKLDRGPQEATAIAVYRK